MIHIRKKDSSKDPHIAYTVVISDGYGGDGQPPLNQHPCILNEPDIFEVCDDDIPPHFQTMIYQSI
jgi:hypothetical protein